MALWAEYDWLLGRPWGPWLYKLPLCYFISLELGIFLLYQTIYIYSHYYVYVYLLLTLPVCRYQPFASRWSKFERFSGSTFLFFMPTYRLPLLYFFSLEMLCTIVLQAINPYRMVALGFSPLFLLTEVHNCEKKLLLLCKLALQQTVPFPTSSKTKRALKSFRADESLYLKVLNGLPFNVYPGMTPLGRVFVWISDTLSEELFSDQPIDSHLNVWQPSP